MACWRCCPSATLTAKVSVQCDANKGVETDPEALAARAGVGFEVGG